LATGSCSIKLDSIQHTSQPWKTYRNNTLNVLDGNLFRASSNESLAGANLLGLVGLDWEVKSLNGTLQSLEGTNLKFSLGNGWCLDISLDEGVTRREDAVVLGNL
jgi:hypothetical protein